jgi:hypothetical protein
MIAPETDAGTVPNLKFSYAAAHNRVLSEGRMTVFASGGKARTFDYRAGDVGCVPFAMGH